jgi:hypothetical protein
MKFDRLLIFAGAFLVLPLRDCSKILSVYSTPSKSHLIFAQNLFVELAKRGHEVSGSILGS